MKNILILIALLISINAYSQLYQGPAEGSVPSGVIVSTENFGDNLSGDNISPFVRKPLRNKIPFKPYSDDLNKVLPSAEEGSNYFNDPRSETEDGPDPIIFKSYQGFLDPGSYIPPDQYIAAGPTHIIGTDNGRIRIWDKNGRIIKTISANAWFGSALSGVGAFDPKVVYDHFAKRWVMVWLDQEDNPARGYFLISVSDDSIPIGTWYNWAIPSTVNGTTYTGSWGDYQGVGFDNQALYLTANQFVFGGNFQGTRIRIIPKTNLYSNTAGILSWFDLWDIREPSSNSRTFGTRPSIMYSPSSEYYLLCQSPFQTGTFVVLYKISNPTTNPTMTATNIPVTTYYSPPQASQLGGSSTAIETGGNSFKFEPVFRNGYLWAVHSVRNPEFTGYSSLRYLKINTSTSAVAEDAVMGAEGFWFFYPSLTVDKDQNVAITYSRSSNNEYIGAFYTSRLNTDPPNTLSGSRLIQSGKANYVKTFGSGRNRWGDYSGIWLDPTDQNNFWAISQYAETPANTWAAWVAGIRLIPFSGAKIFTDKDSLNFGTYEVSFSSDTLKFNISSIGEDTLYISNIQSSSQQFQIITPLNFPVKIGYNQSKEIKVRFLPSIHGISNDSISIFSNDLMNPQKKIKVTGKGFIINPATAGVIYGITGNQSNGALITINKNTGSGNTVGLSGFSDITSISIRPSDYAIYGVTAGGTTSRLVRINASLGDAYYYKDIPIGGIRNIAFDINNDVYCATQSGLLYKYNIVSNDTLFIGNTNINNLYGIAINPINGQLWGISLLNKIYKINKATGTSSEVGTPGFNLTASISFNHTGKLYGTYGLGVQQGNLVLYDTVTGIANLLGNTGYQALNSIAISQQTVGIENISNEIPQKHNLNQNYPNPFNPVTNIKFDIPKGDFVNITVYDALGRTISVLVNENLKAGSYNFTFEGSKLSSGIYYYRMIAGNYNSVRKMLLIK